jgi:hypothetical protein
MAGREEMRRGERKFGLIETDRWTPKRSKRQIMSVVNARNPTPTPSPSPFLPSQVHLIQNSIYSIPFFFLYST